MQKKPCNKKNHPCYPPNDQLDYDFEHTAGLPTSPKLQQVSEHSFCPKECVEEQDTGTGGIIFLRIDPTNPKKGVNPCDK